MQGQRRIILLEPDCTPPSSRYHSANPGEDAELPLLIFIEQGNFMSLTVNLEVEVGVESKGSQCPIPPREGVPPRCQPGTGPQWTPNGLSGNSGWRVEGREGEGCSWARVGVAGLRAHGCV